MSNRSAAGRAVSQQYGAIDIAKVFFTFCILALHSGAFPTYYYPLFRMGVPFFFITSSYFLFSKLQCAPDRRSRTVKSYLWRNIKLYAVWFVILLPVTFLLRNWFDGTILSGVLTFLRSLLFGSTFRVSWYLSATVLGTLTVVLLSRRLSTRVCILISLPVYALCCLFSNYHTLLGKYAVLQELESVVTVLIPYPFNSFTASLVWIALGKYFAEKPRDGLLFSKRPLLGLGISLVLFAAEAVFVAYFRLRKADDCYLTLIPVSYFLFMLLLRARVDVPNGKTLRKICTITFVTNASAETCLSFALRRCISNGQIVPQLAFVGMLIVCLSFSFLVIKLEKHPRMGWLRHLY